MFEKGIRSFVLFYAGCIYRDNDLGEEATVLLCGCHPIGAAMCGDHDTCVLEGLLKQGLEFLNPGLVGFIKRDLNSEFR